MIKGVRREREKTLLLSLSLPTVYWKDVSASPPAEKLTNI